MSIYITPQDELHVEYQGIALTCPHCQTLTHLTPIAVPKFEELMRRKPKQIGIVFRCDACIEPIFLKFAVKAIRHCGSSWRRISSRSNARASISR